ncbi:enoyl-CoA hydratase [Nocardiopsis sp. TSRI0078]|nr:enoyl-CoA hydratase [Nocardiopsis sp. TSRI0078]
MARWHLRTPKLSGRLGEDADLLRRHTEEGEELLAELPPRPERDAGETAIAATIHGGGREIRGAFLDLHAEPVFATICDGNPRPRLSDIAFEAADRFPGLAPTRKQMVEERTRLQAHKEGREIDQGVLFRGLLRAPSAGSRLVDAMLRPTARAKDLLSVFAVKGRVELPTVVLERSGAAAHLTVTNTRCLNAEDDQLITDMETAVDLVFLEERVHVGVVRGGLMTHPRYLGRRVFSAGINLKELRNGDISFVDFLLGRELGYLHKILRGVVPDTDRPSLSARAVHKPWIAAVDSFAIGGGMQLLFLFDRVIAEKDAFFSLPAAREGIVPGAANLRLGRFVGSREARRIILAGHRLRATDPEARLLCDEVVESEEMDTAVERAIQDLDNPAVVDNRRMIALAEEPLDHFRAYMAEFSRVQAERLYAADVLEKVATPPGTRRRQEAKESGC